MTEPQQPQYESATGCLIKIDWLLLGPGFLFAVAAAGVANRPRLGSVWDYAIAVILLSLIAARYLDRGKPTGEPAKAKGKADISSGKYAAIAVAATAVIFGIVHWVLPLIFR